MKSLFTSSKKYVIIESPSKKLMYGTKRAARGDIMVKKEMIAMLLAGGQGSRGKTGRLLRRKVQNY